MTTDTTEKGLERLICTALTGYPCDPSSVSSGISVCFGDSGAAGGSGWICGSPGDYNREYCVDLAQLAHFLHDTQPRAAEVLSLADDSPTRRAFLARLQGEVTRKGTINVLRQGGQARAMVVTGGIERAIQYYHAIREYLAERKSPYRAIVAFSGEPEYGGVKVTEASLNGFPSNQIAERIQEDPYRFLICAEKFQTGYDEPLLHTMYVDKILSGIKAVQTLSRLNRAHPKKHDVFVLDFMNDTDMIRESFADYYRTTILSEETDPDKLHDMKARLDGYQVYDKAHINQFVEWYLGGADRDRLDPILDACVAVYKEQLDEDGQVGFKGKAKAFVRTYGFLTSILPYAVAEWEKTSIFLNFLIPKLPAPVEEDLSKGILETIDMDSYRVEKKATMKIQLPDEDAYIEPVPTGGKFGIAEPELDRLSSIIKTFNDQFGNYPWTDTDRVHKLITQDIPARVAVDTAYRNARENSDRQNARIEHDKALARVMTAVLKDDTELFKQFMDNESFKRWITDTVFGLTYDQPRAGGLGA
jgi:type I restriction enzyme R subunit